jgi:hypothetical protein
MLLVGRIILLIVGYQLHTHVGPAGHCILDILNQVLGVVEFDEIKVKSSFDLADGGALRLLLVLQNHLLKEQKGTLVVHLLSDLNLGPPLVGCIGFLAVVALKVLDDHLYDMDLLKHYLVENFLLHRHLDLDPP